MADKWDESRDWFWVSIELATENKELVQQRDDLLAACEATLKLAYFVAEEWGVRCQMCFSQGHSSDKIKHSEWCTIPLIEAEVAKARGEAVGE